MPPVQIGPKDQFGREINYLRISVIDHCNLRCVYCMPVNGLRFLPSQELLTPKEIAEVARVAVSVGFRKFRLTGGEPTLRPDLREIVQRLIATDEEDDGGPREKHEGQRRPGCRGLRALHPHFD